MGIRMKKKDIVRIRSNIAGVLAVLWMIVIFIFSAQNKEESSVVSEGVSDQIVSMTGWLFHLHIDAERIWEIARLVEYFVRKGAHMTEFAILAILLYVWIGRWQLKRLYRYGIAVVLTILYACSDEFHQLFVEGRAGLISDVIVDSVGAIIGLAVFLLLQSYVLWRRRKRTDHNRKACA